MSLIPFYVVDRDTAVQETRTLTFFKPQNGVPPGNYGLVECYCPDPHCDCRRVMLNVAEEKNPEVFLASIGYGFDRDAPDVGPYLDPLNPQSRYAEALLRLVNEVVLSDPHYVARLKRHYAMTKAAAADPQHPAYDTIQSALDRDLDVVRPSRPYVAPEQVGRNDPCPCGSGKKYKHCCMRKGL